MPVTARLSKRFYETFGDENTNELVDLLNSMHQSYRTEFRELFEAHFGRLEAAMGRMSADLRAEITASELRMTDKLFRYTVGSLATLLGLLVLLSKLGWT